MFCESVMEQQSLKPKDFAKLIGKSVLTLQRWDRDGKLVAYRSESNRRYYTYQQYLEYIGIHASSAARVVAYCRTSCALDLSDLELQKQHIDESAKFQQLQIEEWYVDHNSSLNYQREQFNRLMEHIELGQIRILFLAHKDRLVRFGYEWFENFCKRHGTEIKLVCQSQFTPDKKELLGELKLIINLFSGKVEELGQRKEQILELITQLEK